MSNEKDLKFKILELVKEMGNLHTDLINTEDELSTMEEEKCNLESKVYMLEGFIDEFISNVDYYNSEIAGSWRDIKDRYLEYINDNSTT